MITLTLSCDHRVVDGARAAIFMNDVAKVVSQLVDLRLDSPV